MKILIINQATRNHGDEAAGKALIRSLYNNGHKNISVSYNDKINDWNENCFLNYKDVKQLPPIPYVKYSFFIILLHLFYSAFFGKIFINLFSNLKEEYRRIKEHDIIISAPGGPNIGKYKDLKYLWRIYVAYSLGKKYYIYSPSIGPFEAGDKRYVRVVRRIFRNSNFLSLRDAQSYSYANDLKVPFEKAIDTAFLESHSSIELPPEILEILPEKFVVIVPHELYKWHKDFMQIDSEKFDLLFLSIIKEFSKKGKNVVLLPQIFESPIDDESYFMKLQDGIENVIVIPTKYSSDIQQKIIERSSFVVGARYHTIVFAINNKVPFYCLSYEHKMADMLHILGLEANSKSIKEALDNPIVIANLIHECYMYRNQVDESVLAANERAKSLAKLCFDKFISNF
ncbi:MAG: polysaccharide pyruvyl transferase family protein [Bacteroidales bacterium]|jgi:colanic acid/amylovoran biosynthesis protein|nr:polysaccharide pyruvyl transferase family protein [Bacteroidales bacterium]